MAITGKGLEEPLARILGIFALTDGSRPKAAAHAVTLSVGYAAVAVLGDLGRDGFDGSPFGGVVITVLHDHAHGTLTNFGGVGIGFLHASFSQELRPPRNPA